MGSFDKTTRSRIVLGPRNHRSVLVVWNAISEIPIRLEAFTTMLKGNETYLDAGTRPPLRSLP